MYKIITINLAFLVSSYAFTLNEGYKLALENDMETKVNESSIKNIKIDEELASSLFKPSVDFSATVQESKTTDNSRTPDKEKPHTKTDEYKITITQPVFDGFESSHEKELQKYRYKSAVYYLKESQNKLALNYTQTFINTLKQKDLLILGKEAVSISENIFLKVNKKIDSGYGTQLEYNEAKAKLAENKVNYQSQKISFKDSLENLKFYVQKDFDTSELIKPKFNYQLPVSLEAALSKSLEYNPSLKVSQLNLDVAKYEAKKSSKNFYPSLNFVSSYQVNDTLYNTDTETNNYKVGFQLNYNLYNGGKDSLEKRKALQAVREKQYIIRKTENEIENDLRLSWANYELNKEKNEALEEYLFIKKDLLDSTIKEFDLGLKSLYSLLTMHTEYIEVKQDYISNSYDLLLSKYKVLSSIGTLNEVLIDNKSLPTKQQDLPKLFENLEYSFDKVNHVKNENSLPLNKKEVINIKAREKEIVKQAEEKTSFKTKFLNAKNDKYTINLALSYSEEDAKKFLQENNIKDEAFQFSFGTKKTYYKIMMGVYNSKEDAQDAINSLSKTLKSNQPRIERVSVKQNLFKKYHFDEYVSSKDSVIVKKDKKILETKKKAKVEKKLSFKDKFLFASKDKYTINLALAYNENDAKKFLEEHNIEDQAFHFSFGKRKTFQKIMMGVYDSKKEAKKAIKKLSKSLKSNKPRIEKVTKKQKLFKKYHYNDFMQLKDMMLVQKENKKTEILF